MNDLTGSSGERMADKPHTVGFCARCGGIYHSIAERDALNSPLSTLTPGTKAIPHSNGSNIPDVNYTLTVMDSWARDAKHDGGPSKACELAAASIRWQKTEIERLRGTIDRVENQLFALASGLEGARQRRGSHETSDGPTPHHVRYDRSGWLCSVCGGWNDMDVVCQHPHTPKASEQQPLKTVCQWEPIEEGSRCFNTCKPGEEFNLDDGCEPYPFCHWCGRPVVIP